MNKYRKKVSAIAQHFTEKAGGWSAKALLLLCGAGATLMASPIASATSINTSLNLDSLFGGIIDIIIQIAMYIGIVLAAGGVFSLVLAYKDENAEGQSRAVRLIVVGGALIGLRTILAMAGIIN